LEKENRDYYTLEDFKKIHETLEKPLNVAIIGGGCAGLTAGIYAGRAELSPVIFAGGLEDKGGLLVKTSIVENFPGFPNGILGYDLIDNMENQAINCGATVNQNIFKIKR
jgi:thioredoxin reductase (NADPH)